MTNTIETMMCGINIFILMLELKLKWMLVRLTAAVPACAHVKHLKLGKGSQIEQTYVNVIAFCPRPLRLPA